MKNKTSFLTTAALAFVIVNAVQLCHGSDARPGGKNHKAQTAEANEAKAIALVQKQKEVRQWQSLFKNGVSPATGGRPGFMIDNHKGDVYTVRVVEDKPDQVVTFKFYDVNVKTGKVKAAQPE